MNYVVDIVVVALLAAFAGRGVTRGLILSAGKLVTLAGGLVGAHLGAFYLKAPVAERIIFPWLSTSTGGAAETVRWSRSWGNWRLRAWRENGF